MLLQNFIFCNYSLENEILDEKSDFYFYKIIFDVESFKSIFDDEFISKMYFLKLF